MTFLLVLVCNKFKIKLTSTLLENLKNIDILEKTDNFLKPPFVSFIFVNIMLKIIYFIFLY